MITLPLGTYCAGAAEPPSPPMTRLRAREMAPGPIARSHAMNVQLENPDAPVLVLTKVTEHCVLCADSHSQTRTPEAQRMRP